MIPEDAKHVEAREKPRDPRRARIEQIVVLVVALLAMAGFWFF